MHIEERSSAIASLEAEGWFVTEWTDAPLTAYAEHSHAEREVRFVLEGSMTIVVGSVTHDLGPGDRVDIHPGQPHRSRAGPQGVHYLAGR